MATHSRPPQNNWLDEPAILFVDDDVANLKVLEVHLSSTFRVVTAQNATDALSLLERGEHDIGLVVADQRMAGLTGVELLTLIRKRFPDVGRMLITAYADLEPVVAAINEGQISGYIKKPWNPSDIRMLLRSGLERVTLQRRLRAAEFDLLRAEQNAVLGFVAAGVGHEINQPSTVLRMNLSILQDDLVSCEASMRRGDFTADQMTACVQELRSVIQDCLSAVDVLSTVSNDLRVIASARQVEPKSGVSRIQEAIQRALRFISPHMKTRAEVRVIAESDFRVRADESRLTQVLLNLMGHAAQRMDQCRDRGRGIIEINAMQAEARLVVSVSDNGPSMSEDDLKRVFDPFRTSTSAIRPADLGLGLSRRIAEDWGGSLEVSNQGSVGVVYKLTLDCVAEILPSSPPPSGEDSAPDSFLLLVVDDEETVERAVERILREVCRVDACLSGAEAIEKLRTGTYHGVLCDLQMPNVDGVAVYRFLETTRPEMIGHVAIMTGGALSSQSSEFLDEVRARGVSILEKPFDPSDVRAVVKSILRTA